MNVSSKADCRLARHRHHQDDDAAKLTQPYLARSAATRARRLQWWQEARFGLFLHWGLYAQLGRHEWAMNRERIPVAEYEQLAATWKPKPGFARKWAALARSAGMKYMVLTTKHHEGFLLWDSKLSDYNAAKCGPGRDLVREYVEAAREFGLRIGFYYSLVDWHHPDGLRCAKDEGARRRFVDYVQGGLRELLTNYGKIDILWYDVPWPLGSAKAWESARMNALALDLQPDILINDRSPTPGDFGTPEENITPAEAGRGWEACMTFNGAWGWQPSPPADWISTRSILNMLRQCVAGGGNLLLNVGPMADGAIPPTAVERLTNVGRWLKKYGIAVYGSVQRVQNLEWMTHGAWTRKGDTFYYWCTRWPGRELAIGGLTTECVRARLVGSKRDLPLRQTPARLLIGGLPRQCPDKIAKVALIELKFIAPPTQILGRGCDTFTPSPWRGRWQSPFVNAWQVSRLLPKPTDGIAAASAVSTRNNLAWTSLAAGADGFANIHDRFGDADGLVYFSCRYRVTRPGALTLQVGHDGGCLLFVDGAPRLCVPERVNPALPDRSGVTMNLRKGVHEIVIALDTDAGHGWGVFLRFQKPRALRRQTGFPVALH